MITDNCTIDVKPYQIDIPEQDITDLKSLLKASRITRGLWDNSGKSSETKSSDYGIKREWLERARDAWLEYDWYVYPPPPACADSWTSIQHYY
jgi:hypothetical protein